MKTISSKIFYLFLGLGFGLAFGIQTANRTPVKDALEKVAQQIESFYEEHRRLPDDLEFCERSIKIEIDANEIEWNPDQGFLRSGSDQTFYDHGILSFFTFGRYPRAEYSNPEIDVRYRLGLND